MDGDTAIDHDTIMDANTPDCRQYVSQSDGEENDVDSFESDNEYDPGLEIARQANDQRLKSRFEDIFQKYERDFTAVGDEIDLNTGMIVVDNGHLAHMRHEADPGGLESPSQRFVKAFAVNLGHEAEGEGEETSTDKMEDGDGDDEGAYDDYSEADSEPVRPAVALQALCRSITDQMAQAMDTYGTSESECKSSAWYFPELPQDVRPRDRDSKRLRNSVATDLSEKPYEPRESLWAPVHHPRPRKKARLARPAGGDDKPELFGTAQEDLALDNPVYKLKACSHCDIRATTTWRTGPSGQRDLCNACGMYFYRYGLMKPLRTALASECEPKEDLEPEDAVGSPYSANTSRRLAEPATKHGHFTVEEDALAIKLKEIDNLKWELIGAHFPGRTSYAVQCRYSKLLCNKPSPGRSALIEQGYSYDPVTLALVTREGGFTEMEDEYLVQLREENELDWSTIAELVQGSQPRDQYQHSPADVEARYDFLVHQKFTPWGTHKGSRACGTAPKNTFKRFSPEEDELIIKLREVDRLKWDDLARDFPGRSGMSVQKRYVRRIAKQKHESEALQVQNVVDDKGNPDVKKHGSEALQVQDVVDHGKIPDVKKRGPGRPKQVVTEPPPNTERGNCIPERPKEARKSETQINEPASSQHLHPSPRLHERPLEESVAAAVPPNNGDGAQTTPQNTAKTVRARRQRQKQSSSAAIPIDPRILHASATPKTSSGSPSITVFVNGVRSGKRVVSTPVRLVGDHDSEDELAM